jgi:flagellar protein FliS
VQPDPQSRIIDLVDAAIEHISAARGSIVRGEPAQKARLLNRAVMIVRDICTALSQEVGNVVAESVVSLQDYLDRRLLCAMLDNDVSALDEARYVLHDVRCAWIFIPYEARVKRAQP